MLRQAFVKANNIVGSNPTEFSVVYYGNVADREVLWCHFFDKTTMMKPVDYPLLMLR